MLKAAESFTAGCTLLARAGENPARSINKIADILRAVIFFMIVNCILHDDSLLFQNTQEVIIKISSPL